MRTLITTIYQGDADAVAITKLSPDKIILLETKELKADRKKTLAKGIKMIKSQYGKFIAIEIKPIDLYDIAAVVRDVSSIIDKESAAGNEIVLHISESRKPQSNGVMFAGFMKKDKIKGIYYVIEETNRLLSYPLLDFKLSQTKLSIIQLLAKKTDVKDIIKKLGKSKAMIYAHIQELKKEGYLTQDNEPTEAGRIVVIK